MKFLQKKKSFQKNMTNKNFYYLHEINNNLFDNIYNYKLYCDYMLYFLYLQYTPYILKKTKNNYKLNINSYVKKFFNKLSRHGLKLTTLNSIFYGSNLLFNSILPTIHKNILQTYTHYNTFIYNLSSYK